MRVGFNPNKDKVLPKSDFIHQVIVPVYIPHQKDYFKDSFQILQYCLESLFKTSHKKTYFSIINNGSCQLVTDYLTGLFHEGKIQEVIHTDAIGKLNAILKGLSGQNFQIVTITDADVLFLNDWQQATYTVFETFPKAGAVSTTPNPKMSRYFTSNILFENFFSSKLGFTKLKNPLAAKAFAHSIGSPDLYKEIHLDKILTVAKGNVRAVVGAGHFVATYRGNIFNDLKERFSIHSLGGNSENNLLDKPIVQKGYWRLSTEDNYTLHMGNVLEDWMLNQFNDLHNSNQIENAPDFKTIKVNMFLNRAKTKVFSRLIFKDPIWNWFMRCKGLTKEEAARF